jgi:hypothetical protein
VVQVWGSPRVLRVLSPGTKQPGREGDHSLAFGAEVKNEEILAYASGHAKEQLVPSHS